MSAEKWKARPKSIQTLIPEGTRFRKPVLCKKQNLESWVETPNRIPRSPNSSQASGKPNVETRAAAWKPRPLPGMMRVPRRAEFHRNPVIQRFHNSFTALSINRHFVLFGPEFFLVVIPAGAAFRGLRQSFGIISAKRSHV